MDGEKRDTMSIATTSPSLDAPVLKQGDKGEEVLNLQQALKAKGFNPGGLDGIFGPGTEAALLNFQKSEQIVESGVLDPHSAAVLGVNTHIQHPNACAAFTVDFVCTHLFPKAPKANIEKYLPAVLEALTEVNLGDKPMVLMALSTIRVETGGFVPISEYESSFNTPHGGPPYSLYDFRKDLGNGAVGDGAKYKGRGFIQLTGKANYTKYSQVLGLGNQLVENPELANDAHIAAHLLGRFLKDREVRIRTALAEKPPDLGLARKLVNGGSHGLPEFIVTYQDGNTALA